MPIVFFGLVPWWNARQVWQKAVVIGPLVVLGPLIAFWIGCWLDHMWTPFMVLGIPYGMLLSIPAMRLSGKIQGAIAGFAGGLSIGSLGAKEALVRGGLQEIARALIDLVLSVWSVLVPMTPTEFCIKFAPMGIVYCLFFCLLTAAVIVAVNIILSP